MPGTTAALPSFDGIYTHFEQSEDIHTLRGRLKDDLVRMREILELASSRSIIILNEPFESTTLNDATWLGRLLLERITDLDALCVVVTFIDELTEVGSKTVSMVAGVAPEDPTVRTLRVERRPADGLAHAFALAEKHDLTYDPCSSHTYITLPRVCTPKGTTPCCSYGRNGKPTVGGRSSSPKVSPCRQATAQTSSRRSSAVPRRATSPCAGRCRCRSAPPSGS